MPKGDFVGEFELYVLLASQALGDAAYGLAVRKHLEAQTGREIAVGAVYATLARLEDKGLVTFTVSAPMPVQGGRARKCVRLTAAGRRALEQSTTSLLKLINFRHARGRSR